MKPIEDRYRRKKTKQMNPADVEALSAQKPTHFKPAPSGLDSSASGRTPGNIPSSIRGTISGGNPKSEIRNPKFLAPTDWGDVGAWYNELVGDEGSEYHREVVLPGMLRLLAPGVTDVALDVACGQGVLCRLLRKKGVRVTGVDAAKPLIDAAIAHGDEGITYRIGDARHLSALDLPAEHFTLATCVLAIQNIDPIAPIFEGVARLLIPGGRFVIVMMHPAFRVPKQAHWEWDPRKHVQYRRVDKYLQAQKVGIAVHPGSNPSQQVWAFHRPLQTYVNALATAGLLVDRLEEWTSHRVSDPGPKAAAEDTARKEIPLFLALRAVKPKA